jgi:oxygen-dependent protoporphyrinogen oxidase
MASVHFLISSKSIKETLEATGVIISREDQKCISACSWSSIKWTGRAKKDSVLVRTFVRKSNYLNKSDQEIINAAWADLSDIMNINQKPLKHHIYRWKNCMPVYGMSHLETLNQIDALTSVKSLCFLGASFRGAGVGSCISNAQRLSEAFL